MFFEPSYSPLNTPLAPSFGVMFGVYIYLAPRFAHGMSKSIHTLPFSSGILRFQKGAKPPRKTTRWSLKRPTGEDGGESNPRKANATPAWVGFSSRNPIFFFFFLGGVWDPFMTNQDQHSVTKFHQATSTLVACRCAPGGSRPLGPGSARMRALSLEAGGGLPS